MQHEIESMQLQLLRQQLEKPGGGGLQDGVLGGLTDAERERLIEALGGGGRGAEGEVAALRGQVESLREELAATKASLHQAQAASAATSRSLQDLVEQNTALQMQVRGTPTTRLDMRACVCAASSPRQLHIPPPPPALSCTRARCCVHQSASTGSQSSFEVEGMCDPTD